MRAISWLVALVILGCARPFAERDDIYWAKYRAGLEGGEFVHLYPATHAGCLRLEIHTDTVLGSPPAYPEAIQLDTTYVILGVPEPVGFRVVNIPREWRSRFPGQHTWRETASSVMIDYRGVDEATGLSIHLDMLRDSGYIRAWGAHAHESVPSQQDWDVTFSRVRCQSLALE